MDGIRKNLKRLSELACLPFDEFKEGDPCDLAQHHLRLALEGVFHICTHILSRIPGGRAVEYKEIALIRNRLGDVEEFLGYVKTIVNRPAKFGLELT